MPTPLAPYANLRLLIPQPPAAPANFRDGVPASTASWVLQAFVKGETGTGEDLPSTDPKSWILSGYVTAWAVLPANTSWLAAASAFSWTDTGLSPAGLVAGLSGRGYLGDLSALPTTATPGQQGHASIQSLAAPYGPGGIGGIVRQKIGDRIRVELQVPA